MAIAELRSTITATAARDTGIDFVRALCVLGVVVLHSLMVGVTVTDTGPLFANASDGSWWITPLSWVLQVMPLFFVIGGFAGYTSLLRAQQRGGTAREFVAARIHRLVLPAVVTIGVVGVALTVLLANGVPADLVATAGYRYGQPLWFLGVFLLCQVLLPLFAAAHRRAPWITIGLLVAAAVAVDAVRDATGIDGVGFVNLAFVWLALQQLGFFFADGRIDSLTRRTRTVIGVAAVAALVATFVTGVYSPDLIANINPPTTSLLLVGVAHTMVLSLMRDRLAAWSTRPLPTRFRTFVTPRAMTIYLWHMPVLLAMAGASAVFSLTTGMALPTPSSFEWWMTRPLWLVTVVALTAGLALLLAGIEARRIPTPTRSAKRLFAASAIGTLAIVGLLVVGTTPMTAMIAVALLITSLRLSRPRHGLSAAWPSRRPGSDATSARAMQNT
ncbi:acyltransferase family protein [Microbacterium murale]|uniref:Peptidoglycan/LPS O-acetylase OafA/YrhL n=1 Tax=Microbacterium murale TaxID=1081040 RepID=A0ABU0PEH8_9MICO|nr:acyltransferase [Microbacterium murale]MDQ0645728.1 peptidoglycan/LPS O-acetylase OafA/YrhL [Microbacterium murale]